jgi:hypothetical protein
MAKFTPGAFSQNRKSKNQPSMKTTTHNLFELVFIRFSLSNLGQDSRPVLAEALKRYHNFSEREYPGLKFGKKAKSAY